MSLRVRPPAVLALAALATPAGAQPRLPFPSPAASVSQEIGTSRVTLEYHRPAVRGRAVWGALVPYGETWRLGANEATTIALSHPAKVAGHDVPAIVWGEVDAAVKAKPDDAATLLQAARWALRRKERLAEGRAWLDRSISVQEGFWNRELLGSYLREEGRTAEAIAATRRAIELSKGKAPDGYGKALEATVAAWEAERVP